MAEKQTSQTSDLKPRPSARQFIKEGFRFKDEDEDDYENEILESLRNRTVERRGPQNACV